MSSTFGFASSSASAREIDGELWKSNRSVLRARRCFRGRDLLGVLLDRFKLPLINRKLVGERECRASGSRAAPLAVVRREVGGEVERLQDMLSEQVFERCVKKGKPTSRCAQSGPRTGFLITSFEVGSTRSTGVGIATLVRSV